MAARERARQVDERRDVELVPYGAALAAWAIPAHVLVAVYSMAFWGIAASWIGQDPEPAHIWTSLFSCTLFSPSHGPDSPVRLPACLSDRWVLLLPNSCICRTPFYASLGCPYPCSWGGLADKMQWQHQWAIVLLRVQPSEFRAPAAWPHRAGDRFPQLPQ